MAIYLVPRHKGMFTRKRALAAGSEGGNARALALSPERRAEIAALAAKARWDATPKLTDVKVGRKRK